MQFFCKFMTDAIGGVHWNRTWRRRSIHSGWECGPSRSWGTFLWCRGRTMRPLGPELLTCLTSLEAFRAALARLLDSSTRLWMLKWTCTALVAFRDACRALSRPLSKEHI